MVRTTKFFAILSQRIASAVGQSDAEYCIMPETSKLSVGKALEKLRGTESPKSKMNSAP